MSVRDPNLTSSYHVPRPSGRRAQADVKRLEADVDAASGDVDIFLTCEWPAGVGAAVPAALLPPDVLPDAGAGSGRRRPRPRRAATQCQAAERCL